jgi:hypothetical protein
MVRVVALGLPSREKSSTQHTDIRMGWAAALGLPSKETSYIRRTDIRMGWAAALGLPSKETSYIRHMDIRMGWAAALGLVSDRALSMQLFAVCESIDQTAYLWRRSNSRSEVDRNVRDDNPSSNCSLKKRPNQAMQLTSGLRPLAADCRGVGGVPVLVNRGLDEPGWG